jgi:hypothetical protein
MNTKYLQSKDGLVALAVFALIFVVAYYALQPSTVEEGFETDVADIISGSGLGSDGVFNNIQSNDIIFASPKNVRIEKINDDGVDISFDTPEVSSKSGVVKSYKLIIIKYDNPDRSNPSDHHIIHSFIPDADKCEPNLGKDTMNCTRNIKLDKTNNNGETIYYRLGLMAVYQKGTSSIIGHVNIKTFRLGVSVMKHLAVLQNAEREERKEQVSLGDIDATENDNIIATADGRFKEISAELGGYPDNLFLEEHTGPQSLSELLKRQLSLGILNVNIDTSSDM